LFKDNPQYEVAVSSNGTDFYILKDPSQYHMSRFLAASANERYAKIGLTSEILEEIENNILKATEEKKWDEIAVWVHNIRARRSDPVDEFAAIKMACIYLLLEGEDPNKCEAHWTERKFQMVKNDPALFDFFLSTGLQYTPTYQRYLNSISMTSLERRRKVLEMLTPGTRQM
jgi:hypothetical protein